MIVYDDRISLKLGLFNYIVKEKMVLAVSNPDKTAIIEFESYEANSYLP